MVGWKIDIRMHVVRAWVVMPLVAVGALTIWAPQLAHASECANESIRSAEPFAGALPDCRAYEQVSPVEKNGQNALGAPGFVQTTSDGNAVSYVASQPLADSSGVTKLVTNYISLRESETWLTRSLSPPAEASPNKATFRGLTEDLRFTMAEADEPLAAGAAAEGKPSTYLRDNETGAYTVIAPAGSVFFAAATPDDSYMLFEHKGELSEHPGSSGNNVYEYHEGALAAQNIVEGEPVPAVAGGGGPAAEARGIKPEAGVYGGSHDVFYQQNTISSDGARVFFTDLENGQIYARENGASTVEISQTQVAGGAEPAVYWQAATPDGRYVFFLSEEKLTADATAAPEHPDLYRYDFEAPEGQRLADLTTGSAEGAQVAGVLGASEDGSYVYFVAGGMLASGGTQGEPNIYLWHEGSVSFIATLAPTPLLSEEADATPTDGLNWEQWRADTTGTDGDLGYRNARVTPDGKTLLYTSTLYEGVAELYRYSVDEDSGPACVSCNPNGKSVFPAELGAYMPFVQPGAPNFKSTVPTRNLSASGERVFFETSERLVPEDTNGLGGCPEVSKGEVHACQDVYEWEADGSGSCRATSQDGGCLYLISTGKSDAPSWFGDASEEGEDVFFFTGQSLVGRDGGEERDLYDARVDGGLASQNPPAAVLACSGVEECRSPTIEAPVFGAPGSEALAGAGNLTVKGVVKQKATQAKCARGEKRSHGRCMKVKRKTRKKAMHKHGKSDAGRKGKR